MGTLTENSTTPPRQAHTVVSLSLGARICILVGALFLTFAAYLFWGPLGHGVSNGFPAKCGSAAKPPRDTLGKAVCGSVNAERRAQAVAALAGAVVVAGGGLIAFGVRREPTEESDAATPRASAS